MAGIFTRPELSKIINNADLTPEERVDQIFSLYGRAVDDGFVTKKAAEAAQKAAVDTAKEAWEKDRPQINVKEMPEYVELQTQFDNFKTKANARTSADYAEVKPKFFDRVFDLIDRADGAKPVKDQLAELKKDYEEYFIAPQAAENPVPKFPQFGSKPEGSMPKGEEGAVAGFKDAWGFVPKKA